MEVNSRFSISSFMSASNRAKSLLGINNPEFSQLVSKSQSLLQERLNSKELQDVLKNKSVAMMFLDKISHLIGKHHPNSLEARKFMGGPSAYPSIELIRHLTRIKSLPDLNERMVQNLEKWILSEQLCLPISLIFDAWGAVNEESVNRSTTKGDFSNRPVTYKIEPPQDEVETFSNAMACEMKAMQPGDTFKMPAGSIQHVTRLKFKKNADGTFDLIHFNTGYGVVEINERVSTACKYAKIPAEKLEDPSFWKVFVEVKMQADMTLLNDLLKNLNLKEPPIDLIKWLKKPLQASGSCSFHAAEAEFKYSFIRSFPSIGEGWQAYKLCTSLMVTNVIQHESSELEPSIASSLHLKGQVKRRYLDWMKIQNNPEKLQELKDTYYVAITSIGRTSQEELVQSIENLPPLMALHILDKRLNEGLDRVSYERLNSIRDTFGVNYIGFNQLKWLESTREVMKDVIEFAGLKGSLILMIRDLSERLLPSKWNNEVQVRLNYAILDPSALKPLLTDYLLREDPKIGNQVFESLLKENVIHEDFLYDAHVIYDHIKSCLHSDPEEAVALAKMPMEEEGRKEVLRRTASKLSHACHFEKALELARLLENDDRQAALSEIVEAYVMQGKINQAIEIAHMTGPNLPATLSTVMDALCQNGVLTYALKFAGQVQDIHDKRSALCKVALALIKQGKERAAMHALQRLPFYDLGHAIIDIISRLCHDHLIQDAIIFISHTPQNFYDNKSDMMIEDAFQRIVIYLVENDRRVDALKFASRIPQGELKESIMRLTLPSKLPPLSEPP